MKKFLSLVLGLCLLLALTGCGGTAGAAPGAAAGGYCGTWKIQRIVMEGTQFALSELEVLNPGLGHMQIVIKEGGKAYITTDGTTGELVDWSETDVGILLDGEELLAVDGALRLKEDDDEFWYFHKVSDSQLIERAADPQPPSEETRPPETAGADPTVPQVRPSSDVPPAEGEIYVSGNFEFVPCTDGTVTLTGYTGSDPLVSIPEEIAGCPVSGIGAGAFENRTDVQTVYIWAKVRSIGPAAFRGCSALENIDIPNSVTDIGPSAFENCTALENVYLWGKVPCIAEAAFRNCSALKYIDIPDSVTVIGASAFENCSALENIYLWGDVTDIGSLAFRNCASVRSLDIPSDCTAIGESAFEGCTALETVYYWGEGVLCGANAFANCPNLTGLPEGIVYPRSTASSAQTASPASGGMRPEFLEAMDAYESFYTEYCDFLTAYRENPADLTLIARYGELMAKAVEADKAFAAWDEADLNSEELTYYLAVSTRVMQKLTALSG